MTRRGRMTTTAQVEQLRRAMRERGGMEPRITVVRRVRPYLGWYDASGPNVPELLADALLRHPKPWHITAYAEE